MAQMSDTESSLLINDLKTADKYLKNVIMFEDDLEFGSLKSIGDVRIIIQKTIRSLTVKGE